MTYMGTATCESTEELNKVKELLRELPIEVFSAGLTVSVTYSPKGEERVLRAATVMAEATSILETVKTHGISLLTEKGE